MRIWLYYANAGGGHRGPAKALAKAFEKRYPADLAIRWIDVSEHSRFLRLLLEQGYEFSVHSATWAYAFFYELGQMWPVSWLLHHLAAWLIGPNIRALLAKEKPDYIIATHFLIGPIMVVLRREKVPVPVTVVVTDPYSSPPIWFFYHGCDFIVASEASRVIALKHGVSPERVHLLPQIFLDTPAPGVEITDVREHVPIEPGTKMVLLVGGGNGFPGVEEVLEALLKSNVRAHYVVVCGNNSDLRTQIQAIVSRFGKNVTVFGHVDFLPALMELADVIIAKAGANVLREALSHNKPLIITHYIWGQEKGNVDFIVNAKVGFYVPKASEVPRVLERCLNDQPTREALATARQKIDLKSGAATAVELITSHWKAQK